MFRLKFLTSDIFDKKHKNYDEKHKYRIIKAELS